MNAGIPFRLEGFQIDEIRESGGTIEVTASATTPTAYCPLCHQPSTKEQSQYTRQPADLPCSGKPIHLLLKVRRFFCKNPACECQVFCERIPAVVPVYARRTGRLTKALSWVAFAVGGKGGDRLAERLGMPTSRDKLLRLLRRQPLPEIPAPHVVGIDDWAFRRGHTYGTIICDLEWNRPIELLPDREAETAANWMEKYPSVELVTRDRSEAYACGITKGAPQAIQIADRWHLLDNMVDVAEEVLARNQAHLTYFSASAQTETPDKPASKRQDEALARLRTPQQVQKSQPKRADRLARYNRVVDLHQKGLKLSKIARQVGISERTVIRWLAVGHFPEHKRRSRQPSLLDNHLTYLNQRWEEGCHNATQLWREIRQQGYRGSQALVFTYAWRRRRGFQIRTAGEWQPSTVKSVPIRSYALRQAAILFVTQPEELEDETRQDLVVMRQRCLDIRKIYDLAQRFAQMIRQRQMDTFDPCIQAAQDSLLPELRQFVSGLLRDKAEVIAALKYPWSNGPVEGHINRLKLIKRQMFGRANFDLLRIRVLQPP